LIDQLKSFRDRDYPLNSQITIRNPTLDEITDYGEQKYFSLVKTICSTPADRKVDIWDSLHIYWDKMDEYELFISTFKSLQQQEMSILFGDLDFTSFKVFMNPNLPDAVLRNCDGVMIDRSIHKLLTDYLRQLHRFEKNVDVGYDEHTKKVMIDDDRDEMALARVRPFRSILQPLISSTTNCPEFKYRWDDVWTLPIGVFMDSVARVQKHKNFDFLMRGIYGGNVDIKKINRRELNWMSELSEH